MSAGRFARVADGNHTGDLSKGETRRLRGSNEVQSRYRRLVVAAIAISFTGRRRQESTSLIEPDGLRGNTADVGQVADLHGLHFTT